MAKKTKTLKSELTPEEEVLREEYRQRYFDLGWSTERSDRPKAEKAMAELYARMKLPTPKFVWFDSPMAAVDCIFESTGRAVSLTMVDGQLDAYWVAFYDFCRYLVPDSVSADDSQHLDSWRALVESTGPCWAYTNYCLMSERPVVAKKDGQGLLHCDDGPALQYLDGEALYSVNGIRVDERIVMRPWELTLEEIEGMTADIQAIARDRWCHEEVDSAGDRVGSGGGRWLEETGCEQVDTDVYTAFGDTALLRTLLRGTDGSQYLCCTDSSTDRVYYIRTSPEARTCEEAHMAFNGGIRDQDILYSS